MEKQEKQKECPRCQEELNLSESEYKGPYGEMKVMRCAKCHNLISARLKGEPDRIIKKN